VTGCDEVTGMSWAVLFYETRCSWMFATQGMIIPLFTTAATDNQHQVPALTTKDTTQRSSLTSETSNSGVSGKSWHVLRTNIVHHIDERKCGEYCSDFKVVIRPY